jgi:hypothetical protein
VSSFASASSNSRAFRQRLCVHREEVVQGVRHVRVGRMKARPEQLRREPSAYFSTGRSRHGCAENGQAELGEGFA